MDDRTVLETWGERFTNRSTVSRGQNFPGKTCQKIQNLYIATTRPHATTRHLGTQVIANSNTSPEGTGAAAAAAVLLRGLTSFTIAVCSSAESRAASSTTMIMRRCSSEPAASRRRPLSQGEGCRTSDSRGPAGRRRCTLAAACTSPSVFGHACADTDGPSVREGTTRAVTLPRTASQPQHCCSSELRCHDSLLRHSATAAAARADDIIDTWPRRRSQTSERVGLGVGSAPGVHQEIVVRGEALTTPDPNEVRGAHPAAIFPGVSIVPG